jgi:glutathione S-transferase
MEEMSVTHAEDKGQTKDATLIYFEFCAFSHHVRLALGFKGVDFRTSGASRRSTEAAERRN